MWKPIFFVILCAAIEIPRLAASNTWIYTPLKLKYESFNKDILNMELKILQRGPDQYRLGGFVENKVDLTDEFMVEISLAHNSRENANYIKLPYGVPKGSISKLLNNIYKNYVMPYCHKCAPNAPQFKGNFVAPLTKRRIVVTDCEFTQKPIPPFIPNGYYQLIANISGQANAYIEFYSKLEKKI